MADLTLPQTAYIKKLKPYADEIPSYVQAMDHMAEAAGLTVRRLHRKDSYRNEIFSIYAGSREQIAGCALLANPDGAHWPKHVRHASRVSIECIDPYGRGHWYGEQTRTIGNICLIAEDRYCIMVKHDAPHAISKIGNGIECFEFSREEDDHLIAYVGTKERLTQGKIVSENFFPDDSTEEGRGEQVKQESVPNEPYREIITAELERAPDGVWIYRKFPRRLAAAHKRKADDDLKKLSDYASPEQWLEHEEDMIVKWARVCLSADFLSCNTRAGMRFTMSEVHAAEILNAIEVAAQRIRDIPVKVTRTERMSSADQRNAATSASTDPEFQRFMLRLNEAQDGDQARH